MCPSGGNLKMNKKEEKMKKRIAIFEIVIMIFATVAFSYIVAEIENPNNKEVVRDNKIIGFYSLIVNYIFGRGIVSAAEGTSTCLKTKDGAICQEFKTRECSTYCEAGKCVESLRRDVSQCKMGTCLDVNEGTCQPQSPKETCESGGGRWYDDAYGNNAECVKGCCTWGSGAFSSYVTETTCMRKGNITGSTVSFNKNIKNEIACLSTAKTQEKSACVFSKDFRKSCKFTTKIDCNALKGNYTTFGGRPVLCTNRNLGTDCEKTAKTTCADGKDEIYFVDSCGNTANIYDSNKKDEQNYWDYVVDKSSSCGTGSSNMNSISCGNCNYLLGSMCKAKEDKNVKYGDYVCHDLNCVDDAGNSVKNGESWCLFDGKIGNGRDVVGSRYFKRVCRNGEVVTDACADYRNEICIQSKRTIDGYNFKSAECRINRWNECLGVNSGSEGTSTSCTNNPDCFLMSIDIDKDFSFDRCLPKYPEGFDMGNSVYATEESSIATTNTDTSANSICSSASMTCTVVYKKKFSGWVCDKNCDCLKSEFTEKMNDYCIALGDCGGYINIKGDEGSQGYSVSNAPEINVKSRYAGNEIPDPSKFIDSGGTSAEYNADYASAAYNVNYGNPEDPDTTQDTTYSTISTVGTTVGGLATTAGALGMSGTSSAVTLSYSAGTAVANTATGATSITTTAMTSTQLSQAGLSPIGAVPTATGGTSFIGAIAAPLMIVGIIVTIASLAISLMGIGNTKTKKVKFSCLPWQPPSGGDKCSTCMKDPKKPCSKYRCESLGLRCNYINEGTAKEDCLAVNPKDASAPTIDPLEGALKVNYSYTNVSMYGYTIKGPESDGCIPTFTNIGFGIKHNEPAQCRFSENRSLPFSSMTDYFADSYYIMNHSIMNMSVPSLESLGISSLNTNNRADYTFYIKCRDVSGNKNDYDYAINFCIKPGKDITPPVIIKKDPEHNYVTYNANFTVNSFWTNEPATCRWDYNDSLYDNMNSSMSCLSNITQQEYYGWRCLSVVPMTGNETTFYVRCKDQPWDENINETNRNVNTGSYKYVVKRTDELKISSINPNGTVVGGSEPVTVNLIATTSGGVDGVATCSYKFNNSVSINFLNTYSTRHEQPFNLLSGDKEINIRCYDFVGNSVEKIAKFNISIDNTPSKVTRTYNANNALVVVTNEPATCQFVKGSFVDYKCDDFISRNVSNMVGGDTTHSTNLDSSLTYYIKCKDLFGNYVNGTCDIVVKGGVV